MTEVLQNVKFYSLDTEIQIATRRLNDIISEIKTIDSALKLKRL